METPRVLFVTPVAFNHVTGGGVTFSNLFKGWPKDLLATVHNDSQPTSSDVCETYYELGSRELDFVFPLNRLRSRSGIPAESDGKVADGFESQSWRQIVLQSMRGPATRLIGELPPEKSFLSPELGAWIEDFRPNLIYSILGTVGMMRLVAQIQRRYQLPLAVHFMDDWVSANYRKGLLGPIMRRQMKTLVSELIGAASGRLVISPAMQEEYQRRYDRPFVAIQNTIDTKKWGLLAAKDQSVGEPADIIYVGSIFENAQLESLVECCHAVARLNRTSISAKLTIHSPDSHIERFRKQLTIDHSITLAGPIEDDNEFFTRIAAADLLLLPANFSENSIRFLRYSMPTKVPAYLTVGTPILVYGPSALAQVSYAANERWGHVLDQQSEPALVQAMTELLTNITYRNRLSQRAQQVAVRDHDAAVVRQKFHDILCAAAQPIVLD